MNAEMVQLATQIMTLAVIIVGAAATYFKLNQYHITVNSQLDQFKKVLEEAAFARGEKSAIDKALDRKAAVSEGESSVKTIKTEVIEAEILKTGPKPKPRK